MPDWATILSAVSTKSVPPPGIDAFVVLMLHMDGTDASTTFTDSSTAQTAKTITPFGDAQIDTAQFVFGGASGLFDGTGDYLTTPDDPTLELSADFTIDFRVRFNDLSASRELVSRWTAGTSQRSYNINWSVGNVFNWQWSTDGTSGTSTTVSQTWAPSTATWYHVAVVRAGTNLYQFIDGVQLGAPALMATVPFDGSSPLEIGSFNGGTVNHNGWIDELRISKGIARWTSNFTPPTSAYSP